MEPTQRIAEMIEPSVAALGYDLVRVELMGTRQPTLQIMAERQDRGGMTVEDCAVLSRTISALLDVEDPLPGAYNLEVSSPGIDRPLTRPEDYDRFAGFDARLDVFPAIEGRKRFKGRLLGRDGEAVRLETDTGTIDLTLGQIQRAKLLLTDELIAATQAEEAAADTNNQEAGAPPARD